MQTDDSILFAPEPAPTRRRPSRRPATATSARVAIVGVAVAGALGAAMSGAAPSAQRLADPAISAAGAAVVILAGSRARRSTWVWMAGVATIAAPDLVWAGVGALALVLAVVSQVWDRRTRVLGAVVSAVAVQVLFRLGDAGPFALTLGVGLLAVAPLLVSAYRVAPRRVRRKAHLVALVMLGGLLVATAGFAVATWAAADPVAEGMREARAGLAAARRGDDQGAAEALADSARHLAEGRRALEGWWALPARGVPVLGQQLRAARVATAEGARLTRVSSAAARQVGVGELTFEDGHLDLELVATARDPLIDTRDALRRAQWRLAGVDVGWVVSPLAGRLDELRAEVDSARPDAELAVEAATVVPGMLGADGPRRYFVMFTTPAETRGLGGFVGNWGEITAVDGQLRLARSGRTQELRDASSPSERKVSVTVDGEVDQRLVDYLDRYEVNQPWDALQDVTVSPDLPTVAEVMRQLYPQAGGSAVDGVAVVDPRALAALMRFTGPVRLEGVSRPIQARNAEQFLLVDQYEVASTDERVDLLDEASRKVFEELTTGDLPNPRAVADRLHPVVEQGRLGLVSFHPDEQEFLASIGLDAALPAPGMDGFSLVTANGAQNKIDVYLERRVRYEVDADPVSGRLGARASVTLTNAVPSLDLPDAVVGSNDQGLATGTNEVLVAFYSPHRLVVGTLDGNPIGFGVDRELGWWVYSATVTLGPGESATLEIELEGAVAPFERYELVYAGQPVVVDDEVDVSVNLPSDWEWRRSRGLEVDEEEPTAAASWTGPVDRVLTAVPVAP